MLEKITERIYFMEHTEETDRPALGLIIGDNYSLVVDAGASPRHAKEFQAEIEAMKVPPVKYLVLTHYHWDHVLGLSEWNMATIAHIATEEQVDRYRNMKYDDASLEQAKSKGIYSEFSIGCIKKEIEDREHFTVGKIDAFYNDCMKIDLGGTTCILRHIESPHTNDTTILYVPEEKTMFLGDCIYGGTKDGIYYYDPEKLSHMIDAIEQYEADYYLCAHETLCSREEIVSFWQQLQRSHELAMNCPSLKEALAQYRQKYGEEPSEDIETYIKCFGLRE